MYILLLKPGGRINIFIFQIICVYKLGISTSYIVCFYISLLLYYNSHYSLYTNCYSMTLNYYTRLVLIRIHSGKLKKKYIIIIYLYFLLNSKRNNANTLRKKLCVSKINKRGYYCNDLCIVYCILFI